MPGLDDLASLLGMEQPKEPTDKKQGYDGSDIVLKVRTEKRRGKVLTIVGGFQSTPEELKELLGTLKKTLGTGGQVTDNALERQGDHRDRVIKALQKLGYKIKGQ